MIGDKAVATVLMNSIVLVNGNLIRTVVGPFVGILYSTVVELNTARSFGSRLWFLCIMEFAPVVAFHNNLIGSFAHNIRHSGLAQVVFYGDTGKPGMFIAVEVKPDCRNRFVFSRCPCCDIPIPTGRIDTIILTYFGKIPVAAAALVEYNRLDATGRGNRELKFSIVNAQGIAFLCRTLVETVGSGGSLRNNEI